jgi:ribosomal protein S18 acetylase RimI-like enzyme
MIEIKELDDLNEQERVGLKLLLTEYGDFLCKELNFTVELDDYSSEMGKFPYRRYDKPEGNFLLALYDGMAAGCVGMKKLNDDSCEMKRMYVNPKFRGLKVGEKLCAEIIERAKNIGYKKMVLDTNDVMKSAINLYLKFSFKETEAYCENKNPYPLFMYKLLE